MRAARLGWFGHVLRRDAGYVGRRMLNIEPPRKGGGGGRPKWRFIDAVRDDMRVIWVAEDDAGIGRDGGV